MIFEGKEWEHSYILINIYRLIISVYKKYEILLIPQSPRVCGNAFYMYFFNNCTLK